MFFKSIRFKIVMWYMLVLALTLFVFSALVYQSFSRSLYAELDNVLTSRVGGITDAIDMYWENEKIKAPFKGPTVSGTDTDSHIYFTKVAKQWIEQESGHPQLLNIFVRIFDVHGKQVASSRNLQSVLDLPRSIMDVVADGKNYLDNIVLTSANGENVFLRMLTHPIVKDGKTTYIIQVAAPLVPINTTLEGLKKIFAFVLPLTVILTGITGVFLANKALHPVDDMINTIRQITAKNLNMRVAIPKANDELRRLADTFNDMLVRLDNSLTLQKQFMHDISHELKTPLTILKGQLEVTLNKLRSPKEYETLLRSSLEEIDELSRLVENLLVLARFDNQETRLEVSNTDISILLERTLDQIKILAENKKITVHYDAHGPLIVNADKNYLRRALLNLIDNAICYTPEGGEINILLSKEKEYAIISVSDTGIGISEEDLPRIFDRFYCTDKSHESHGLGLSIVQSIIKAHRGRVEVASVLGKGTTFTVYLPLST